MPLNLCTRFPTLTLIVLPHSTSLSLCRETDTPLTAALLGSFQFLFFPFFEFLIGLDKATSSCPYRQEVFSHPLLLLSIHIRLDLATRMASRSAAGGRAGGGGGGGGSGATPAGAERPGGATGPPGALGLADQREFLLTRDHQQILRRMLASPYSSPITEIEEAAPGAGIAAGGLLTIRHHYVINIPASIFPPNATCWGDLVRAPVSAQTAHFKHLLLMMSAIVSDASFGASGQAAIDPNAAQIQGLPGAHGLAAGGVPGAPGGRGVGAPGQQQQQQQGGGRGRGRGGGGGGGAGGGVAGLGLHGADTRGDVPDANGLMFEINGRRYAKVIPAIEECMNETGKRALLYRLNFFFFDPQFHLGRAIEKTLERNTQLYALRAPDQQYLQFGQIRTVQEFMELVIIPYLEQGMKHRYVPSDMRTMLQGRIIDMRDEQRLLQQGLRLSDDRHPANPNHVFNKALAFCLYLDGVDPVQRDPANYYNLVGAEERIVARAREADRVGPADEVAMDDADVDDPELVVPDDEEEDDDEMGRLMARVGLGRSGDGDGGEDAMDLDEPAAGRGGAARLDAEAESQADHLAERGLRDQLRLDESERAAQRIVNSRVTHLRIMADESFDGFVMPEHVYRISSNLFGRRLLNLPLLEKIRELTAEGSTAALRDRAQSSMSSFDLRDALEQNQRDQHMGIKDDEMHPRYNDETPGLSRAVVRKNRLETLNALASSLLEPPEIRSEHVENLISFRELFREMQMQGMLHRREDHERQAEAEVMRLLSDAANLNYRTQVAGESDAGLTYGGFLPETLTQRLSQNDFWKFAAKHVLMQLRYKNLSSLARLQNKRFPTPQEKEKALFEFRLKASEEFWEIFLHSNELPAALIEARNFFKGLSNKQQWGEHIDLCRDVSSFGNFILTYLSLYNNVFRGASNQQPFMLVNVCHWSTFEYDWGIKPNLLLMGGGSKGKSYLFEVAEVCSCPGTMASWSHVTEKVHSTSTSFSDQTTCMHEAPLSYVQVDKFGNTTLSDPVLKDRLARQRSGTKYFTKDEAGNRVTKEDLVMVMGTILIATNDSVPPDNSPLMQRFIVMAVHDFKRPDFDIGDQSQPLKDLVNTSANNRHIAFAQLFNFYMLLLHKLTMVGVLPEMSTDAIELLLPEILGRLRKLTNSASIGPRPRKQIADVIRNVAIADVNHLSMFSLWAGRYRVQAVTVEGAGGEGSNPEKRLDFRPFHPSMLVREALPRMFVTDEHVVYGLSLLDFLVSPTGNHKIMETIAGRMNTPVYKGDPFQLKASRFRIIQNEMLPMQGLDGAFNTGAGRMVVSRFRAGRLERGRRGQTSVTVTEQEREYDDGGGALGPDYSQPTSFVDPRYCILTADSFAILYIEISRNVARPAPGPNQVTRVLNNLAELRYPAHPAILKLVPRPDAPALPPSAAPPAPPTAASTAARLPAGGAAFGQLMGQARVPPTTTLLVPSLGLEPPPSLQPSYSLMQQPSHSATRELAIRQSRENIQRQNQDRMQVVPPFARGDDSNTMIAGSGDSQHGAPAPAPPQEPPVYIPGPFAKYDGVQAPMSNTHFMAHAEDSYTWELETDKPCEELPIVKLYQDPFDRHRKRVVVAVLLEYVKNEGHKDALHEAIRHVFSNNTLTESRRFITAQPAIYDPAQAAGDFGIEPDTSSTFEPRVMPQFCRMIEVVPTKRNMTYFFASLGTAESDAFISSTLAIDVPDDRAATLAGFVGGRQGIKVQQGVSVNHYFVNRHFQRNGLMLEGSEHHENPLFYQPETQTRLLRQMYDAAGKKLGANMRFIEHYPDDSIATMLIKSLQREEREMMDEEGEEILAEQFHTDASLLLEAEMINHMGETANLEAFAKERLGPAPTKDYIDAIYPAMIKKAVISLGEIPQAILSPYQQKLRQGTLDNKAKQLEGLKEMRKKRAERAAAEKKGKTSVEVIGAAPLLPLPAPADPPAPADSSSSSALPEPEGEDAEGAMLGLSLAELLQQAEAEKAPIDAAGHKAKQTLDSLFFSRFGGRPQASLVDPSAVGFVSTTKRTQGAAFPHGLGGEPSPKRTRPPRAVDEPQ
jgi:hypothetical protein